MWAIAGREWRSLFLTPFGWVVLAVSQWVLAYIFLAQVDSFQTMQGRLGALPQGPGLTELVVIPLLSNTVVVLLIVMPLLTMRAVSEERRQQTFPLLLSSPISLWQIVAGKFIALLGFIGVLLLLVLVMPLSLLLGGELDVGLLLAGLLGLGLVLAAFAAVGIFMSTVSEQPAVAAVGSFGVLLLLWILDWAGEQGAEPGSGILGYLSMLRHYQPMMRGWISSEDVAYYLIVCGLFLALAVQRLQRQRTSG